MAKKIFYQKSDVEKALNEARKQIALLEQKLLRRSVKNDKDREVTLSVRLGEGRDNRCSVLEFTPKAWIKMRALVDSFTGEVQWHGTVERRSDNTFVVKDILVFPHETTATTVVSGQEEYEKWLNELDDETFNSCRFHGHSHVNMGVSPSSVDMAYRHELVDHMGVPSPDTDLFYIFLITNKKGDISVEIYDLTMNALYSTQEVVIRVPIGDDEMYSFIKRAKTCVKEKTVSTTRSSHNMVYTSHRPLSYSEGCPVSFIEDEKEDYNYYEGDDNI